MSFGGLLNEVVSIERAVVTGTPTGVHARTWTVVATGVPAAVQQLRGGLRQLDFGRRDESGALGFFGPEAPLIPGDRIVRADGSRWEATVVEGLRGHHLEAALRRVEPV